MDNQTFVLDVMRRQGAADAQATAAGAASGVLDGTQIIAAQLTIPTWRPRDYSAVPVGTPYQWDGQVYKLWQQHNATGQDNWSPDQAVSLWDVCHTTDPKLAKPYVQSQGARGTYQTGECCSFGGQVWRSLIDNNSFNPADYPAGWEVAE